MSDHSEPVDFGYRKVGRVEKAAMVRAVFDSVAPRYDLMNDLMSFGVHRVWKHLFVTALDPRPRHMLLDLAGGTGDISFGWLRRGGGPAILSDINPSMLQIGVDRAIERGLIGGLLPLVTDAEHLPLPDRCVDRISIAFGLRNCTDKAQVLREARAGAEAGWKVSVSGVFPIAGGRRCNLCMTRGHSSVLPRLGRIAAGDSDSYVYLAESIRPSRTRPSWQRCCRRQGFLALQYAICRAALRQSTRGGGYERTVRQTCVADHLRRDCRVLSRPELIRLLRRADCGVTCVLTGNGARFVTPLTLQALSEVKVYTDLFSLTDENEMGHIQLSRAADLLVVAPATANILARMACGLADDLASTVLLATDKPVLVAPAMNVRMWLHPATQANMVTLQGRGVGRIGPNEGAMACNEFGPGRMAEPSEILSAIEVALLSKKPLAGHHAIVGVAVRTHEANRSGAVSRQSVVRPAGPFDCRCPGGAAGRLGHRWWSGPVAIPDPAAVVVTMRWPGKWRRDRWPCLPGGVAG